MTLYDVPDVKAEGGISPTSPQAGEIRGIGRKLHKAGGKARMEEVRDSLRARVPWATPEPRNDLGRHEGVERVVTPALARIILHIYVPSVLMGFGLGMLLPTLPILARSFGVAPEVAAQAVTALLIGRTVSYFPWGYVVDRFGRRVGDGGRPAGGRWPACC